MEIKIFSRDKINEFVKQPFEEKTAIISITDYNWEFVKLQNKPDYLLQLAFNDIDAYVFEDELGREPTEGERLIIENKYHMFSDEQSKQIAEFYFSVCNNVDILICQCEYGMSRSAAVAAAILEFRNKDGISIFANDKYCPNRVIFRKLLKELNVHKGGK